MNGTHYIKVGNKNEQAFVERYDGIEYVIPANGSVNIPSEAAAHIFGIDFGPESSIDRETIWLHLQRRWGWNRSRPKGEAGSDWVNPKTLFEKLSFRLISYSLVETASEPEEDAIIEPRERLEPGKPAKNIPKNFQKKTEADQPEVA